jgi:hypothetical protein
MTTLITSASIVPSLYNSLTTLTGTQTLSNKTIKTVKENVGVIATAPPTIVNFDVATQPIVWYNVNTTGNFTINMRGEGTTPTTLNSLLAVGDSITANLFVKNGTTPYYATAFQIDGVAITPQYQGGSPFTYGSQFATDLYVMFAIKTGTNAWSLFVSQTKFA